MGAVLVASAADELQAMVDKLRSLSKLTTTVAPKVADAMKGELAKQVREQISPSGKPWQPGEKGKPILKGSADATRVAVVGTTIVLTLEGHYARHHLGAVKGKKIRPILPTRKLPGPMTRAVEEVITTEFINLMEE